MHSLKVLCILAGVALLFGCCRSPDAGLLAVSVKGVVIDPETQSPILFLVDPESNMGLPVWIGLNEARAITLGLEDVTPPRPLTHDLMKRMLDVLNARVERVVISDLKDNTYYATLRLRAGRNTWEVDSRPSDAVAMALKYDAPLFLSRELVHKGVLVDLGTPSGETSPEGRYGFLLQELSPDVARYFGFRKERGVIVTEVRRDSPAEKAGMQKGDIVIALDREAVTGKEDVRGILKKKGKAPSIRVDVYRKGQVRSFTMKP